MVLFASRDAGTRSLRRARLRLRVLMAVFVLAFFSVGLRLVDLTTGARATKPQVLSLRRGDGAPDIGRADILDRRGVTLATNLRVNSVIADPSRVNFPERAAHRLADALGLNEAALLARLKRGGRFAWIKRRISPREEALVKDLGLPGVALQPDEERVYPQKNLVSHVLGFTGDDNQGLAGIELAEQDRLVGGEAKGKGPLVLSIDVAVQNVVREATMKAFLRFHAKGACAIVFDTRTRAFLSLVSLPDFDPNRATREPSTNRQNRCSGHTYELGSLFKIFTTAFALDAGAASLFDRLDASQPLYIGRHPIHDDHAKFRWLTVPEAFAFSSNIGMVRLIQKVDDPERQKGFLRRLGLFGTSKVELPDTRPPLLPRRWPFITQATVAYGHGIAVSPVNYVEAVASLIDDGRFRPGTVLRRGLEDVPPGEPVVAAKTVRDMRWLLWLTTDRGTGDQARLDRYLTGGKTGTADKAVYGRGYVKGAVVASFVSVLPVDDPRYLVLVTLDEPQGDAATHGFRYGGWTAAPVAAEIIERVGPLLGLEPSPPEARARMEARLQVYPAMNGHSHETEEGLAAVRLDP
ncbi:MAG: penicillin-binding protein 2 [Geminicoccaceae bacterium]|nr:penicillin-binding protein 2 [Geminicoccaceae bacterium]